MPTHTLLKDGVVLRHGHGNANAPDPEKEQWHEAHVFHRTDPHAHVREQSWTSPGWSRNNWDVPADRKIELIAKAQRLHDQAFNRAMGYWPSSTAPSTSAPTPTPAVTQNWPEPDEDDADDSFDDNAGGDDEVAPSPASVPSADGLEGKIMQAAQLAVMASKAASAAAGLAKEVQTETSVLKQSFENNRVAVGNLVDSAHKRVETAFAEISFVDDRVKALERAAANRVEYVIRNDDDEVLRKVQCLQHKKFPLLHKYATRLEPARRNIWVQGPAGAGKTHAFEMLAEILGLPYEYIGAIDSPYKLSGHYNATGIYLPTAFRRIYENGGVILLDEVDAGDPRALLEINAALANSRAAFPDGLVNRHKNCIIGCSANTWGLGGDAAYTGRNKLDAAFLNRFVYMTWDYDEDLERQIAGDPGEWVDVVQQVRRDVFAAGTPGMVISPRSSQFGCDMLRGGFTNEEVVEACFGPYRRHTAWPNIGRAAEAFAARTTTTTPVISTPTPAPARNDDDDVVVDMSRTVVFNGRR